MNTSRWMRTAILLLGAVSWTLLVSCSGSTDPAGPGGGGGGGGAGTLSNALSDVQTKYFGGSNEAVFNSLAVLGPLVENLGVRPAHNDLTPDAASLVSCLVDSLVGVVFAYSGGQYVSTGLTGAPADGARFLLYEVDAQGVVNPASQIGYLDVICTPGLPGRVNMTVSVVVGGRTVLSLALSGTHPVGTIVDYSGTVSSADQTGTLQVAGMLWDQADGDSITGAFWTTLGIDYTPTFSLGYHDLEVLATGQKEIAIFAGSFGDTYFEVQVNMQVNPQGGITSGTARFTEGYEIFTVACISGTLDAPVVAPNTGACTVAETVAGTYPLGSTDDIKRTFQAFRSIHAAVTGQCRAALGLVAAP